MLLALLYILILFFKKPTIDVFTPFAAVTIEQVYVSSAVNINPTQLTLAGSKSTLETLEKGVKYV